MPQQFADLHRNELNRDRYSVSVRHRSNGITGRHKILNGGKCYIVLQIVQKHSTYSINTLSHTHRVRRGECGTGDSIFVYQ